MYIEFFSPFNQLLMSKLASISSIATEKEIIGQGVKLVQRIVKVNG